MSGVQKGSKRGPYAQRQNVSDMTSLKSSTESVQAVAERLGTETVVAMRKAVRKQNITQVEQDLLLAYLDN